LGSVLYVRFVLDENVKSRIEGRVEAILLRKPHKKSVTGLQTSWEMRGCVTSEQTTNFWGEVVPLK